MAFNVLCADPPWPFVDKLPGKHRGAAKNYALMSVEDICRYPLPELADDCTLFLWRVASMQQEALDVVRMWGFAPVKTEIVWLKKTVHGNRWFGMGHITRAEHETCLVAQRGRVRTLSHSVRSTFVTDDVEGLSAPVVRHSAKPEMFYTIVEQLRAGPYCELFARRHRPGWTCIGDEL